MKLSIILIMLFLLSLSSFADKWRIEKNDSTKQNEIIISKDGSIGKYPNPFSNFPTFDPYKIICYKKFIDKINTTYFTYNLKVSISDSNYKFIQSQIIKKANKKLNYKGSYINLIKFGLYDGP